MVLSAFGGALQNDSLQQLTQVSLFPESVSHSLYYSFFFYLLSVDAQSIMMQGERFNTITKHCWIASRHAQTCSPVGCCCCIARPHEHSIFFARCFLFWQRSARHDWCLWRCLCKILGMVKVSARILFARCSGRPGLPKRSADKVKCLLGDCFPKVFKRYLDLVADFVSRSLLGETLMGGARPPAPDPKTTNRVVRGKGGSHLGSSRNSETCSCSQPSMMPSGPFCGPRVVRCWYVVAHHALQSCDPFGLFHVSHPLFLPIPSAAPSDEAYLPVWPPYRFLWPPPRSSCMLSQGFLLAVESVVARVCREGGARNIMVRDMDFGSTSRDSRAD